MKREHRGQSALEYLVTYGWAILAIVIIAAVLWFTGVFNPDRFATSKQSGGLASFTIIDYTVAENGAGSIVLANNVGRTVNSVVVSIGSGANITGWSQTITANGQAIVSIAAIGASTGGQYSVEVNYTDSLSNLPHSEVGFIKVV